MWDWTPSLGATQIRGDVGVFKRGFRFIGNNPMADVAGIEFTLKTGTEAKFKIGSPELDAAGKKISADEAEIGASVNVNTFGTYGMVLPMKILVMGSFKSLEKEVISANIDGYISDQIKAINSDGKSFADRAGLGASKLWGNNMAELDALGNRLEDRRDNLTLAAFTVIMLK